MTFFRIAATDVFKCHNIRTERGELCQKLIKSHKQIIGLLKITQKNISTALELLRKSF